MKTSIAYLEEFLQEKYVEVYDKDTGNLSKVELLQQEYDEYFYMPKNDGFGDLTYIVNSEGKAMYLINKSGLPKEVQNSIKGGDAGNKTYQDYLELNDVYGITKDLKVYYSQGGLTDTSIIGGIELDDENWSREIFSETNSGDYYNTLGAYDSNGDGTITSLEAKAIKSLTIGSSSSIASLKSLYNLSSLQKLVVENKENFSLDGIQNCPNLYYVYFINSTVSDYSPMIKMENRLRYLYFYNIDDVEFGKACRDISTGKFTKLNDLIVSGNISYLGRTDYSITYDNAKNKVYWSNKASKTITTLKPLSILSSDTQKAVLNLCVNNMNIGADSDYTQNDENAINLSYLSGFENLYLLRVEYNQLKSLKGLENANTLKYLYARNNLLGTDCSEDGEENTENCLSSLSGKKSLSYLDVENNSELKWVSYLSTTGLTEFWASGCSSEMAAGTISERIIACGTNYRLPCKYINGTVYKWSDYYYLTGKTPITGKEELTAGKLESDLLGNTTITALSLENCKQIDITNEVINDILKSMPQLKYVMLKGTNLSTLGFCEIKNGTGNYENDLKNLNLYAYCPNLIELDLRDTYISSLKNLNNVVKKTNENKNGRNFGTLRINSTNQKDGNGNSTLDLIAIQDIISNMRK